MDEIAVLPRPLPRPSRRVLIGVFVALVVVAGLIGSHTSTPSAQTRKAAAAAPPTTGVASGAAGLATPTGTGASAGGLTGSFGGSAPVFAPASAAGTDNVAAGVTAAVGATTIDATTKIVKTGSIEVGVGKGGLQGALDTVTTAAAGFGGFVSSAQTTGSAAGDDRASGTLTVRVPAAQFEQLLSKVRGLGQVHSVTTAGQDVTAQFTDLDARITALKATRDQLLTIMGSASAVQDVLSVQDRLTNVQAQLDSLVGQQKLLADQADLSTLTVNVVEPGAASIVTPVDDTWTFGDAFREARHRFAEGLKDVIAGTGTVALIAVGLAVVYVIYVMARRRRVATAPSAPT